MTRLNSCCEPVAGLCSTVVSESFVTLTLTAEIEEPDEFTTKLANGTLCLNELGPATLKRYNAEVVICNGDPDLFNIFTGSGLVTDFDDNAVGFQVDNDLGSGAKFALEVWTRVPSDQCVTGEPQKYIYWLLPCLSNGRLGDFTIENGPLNFTITAEATSSSTWDEGPYDVVAQDALGTPGPLLSPLPDDVPLHIQLTVIPPPVEECGCIPLVIPT